jgi:putative restriction endonuclease
VKAVFTHKAASIYDDKPEECYHFPETYLRQAEAAVDDFILYYEPGRVGVHDRGRSGRRAYVAVAQVTGQARPCSPGLFLRRHRSGDLRDLRSAGPVP